MESKVFVEAERPQLLERCLSPSLRTDENVSYTVESNESGISVEFEVSKLGHLRGSSDTVFRLLSLSNKLLERDL